jgi:hypothetical protein
MPKFQNRTLKSTKNFEIYFLLQENGEFYCKKFSNIIPSANDGVCINDKIFKVYSVIPVYDIVDHEYDRVAVFIAKYIEKENKNGTKIVGS